METLTTYIIPFLVILTVLVFVHEMGHYLIARRNGVKVEAFSIGFGPELFGWHDKAGTRWRVAAVPLGGYVKMFGDTDASSSGAVDDAGMSEEEKAVSFHHKPLGARSAIVAAGPIANFLFAILILALLYGVVGRNFAPPIVDEVVPDSAAAAAGLQQGDRFLSVNGQPLEEFGELRQVVFENPGVPLAMEIDRGGETLALSITPQAETNTDRLGIERTFGVLGVRSTSVEREQPGPFRAVELAVSESWSIASQTLVGLGEMLVGARGTEELGGPLRIAQMSGEVAQIGLATTVWFVAALSVTLGVINLVPVPILDGGHLLFYALEAIRGRPLGEKAQEAASIAGLAVVVSLMLFVTWNDLVQLKVVEFLGSLLG